MIDVRSRRCARGEDFSGMNQRAGMCRRQAYSQQRGVRQQTVGHTKRAVDQLCQETHGEQKPPDVHRITSGDKGNSTSFRSMFAVTVTADVRRKLARLNGMSVLRSTADVVGPPRHVRFVPNPDLALRGADLWLWTRPGGPPL